MNPVIKLLRKNKSLFRTDRPKYFFKIIPLGNTSILEECYFEFSWIMNGKVINYPLHVLTNRSEVESPILYTRRKYGPISYETAKVEFDSHSYYTDTIYDLLLDTFPEFMASDLGRSEISLLLIINFQYLLSENDGTVSIRCKPEVLRMTINGNIVDLSQLKKFEFGLFSTRGVTSVRRNP